MNTKQVGDISELKVITKLVSMGYTVSIPYGDRARYDIIVDNGYGLKRVQIKTANYYKGCLIAKCKNKTTRDGKVIARSYIGEIDYFLIYSPDFDTIFKYDIEEIREKQNVISLRVDEPKNGQKTRIKWAKNYEI